MHYSYQPRVVPGIGRIYRVVKRKRIPSFISGITSVIKHRFEPFFQCYKQKFMARKREVLPLTTPLLCDHLTKQTLLLISVLSVYTLAQRHGVSRSILYGEDKGGLYRS